jgi:hypothetical protein
MGEREDAAYAATVEEYDIAVRRLAGARAAGEDAARVLVLERAADAAWARVRSAFDAASPPAVGGAGRRARADDD